MKRKYLRRRIRQILLWDDAQRVADVVDARRREPIITASQWKQATKDWHEGGDVLLRMVDRYFAGDLTALRSHEDLDHDL